MVKEGKISSIIKLIKKLTHGKRQMLNEKLKCEMKTRIDINGTVMRVEWILLQIEWTMNFQFITEITAIIISEKLLLIGFFNGNFTSKNSKKLKKY